MSLIATIHDRRCTHVDENDVRCITRLCYLNPGPDCFAHSVIQPRRVPADRVVEQLMQQVDERLSA